MRFALLAFLIFALVPAACTQFPQLDGTVPPEQAAAPFPDLVPLGPVIARAGDSRAETIQTDLGPRLANLRARAAGLRGPVISPDQRARMLRGVS